MTAPASPHPGGTGQYAKLYQVRCLHDAYQAQCPMRYLVDGIVAVPSLNMWYGAPGTFKSMILLDLAVCVVAGKPWLAPLPLASSNNVTAIPVQQAAVLWVDLDNGMRRTEERIQAFAKTRQLPADAPFHYVSMPDPWPDASDRFMCKIITQLILELHAELVVIDNLGLVLGNTDENSAGMAKVMGNFRKMAEDATAAVQLLHHQRKTNGPGIRKGETLRGHSSIEAGLDLAVCVEREPTKPEITLIPTKVRDFDVRTLGAYFSYNHQSGTKQLESALFYGQEVETADMKLRRRIGNTVVSELQAMTANGDPSPNKGALVKAVKERLALWNIRAGRDKVSAVITDLVRLGTIIEHTGKHNEKTYVVP